jgi:hypothetical protein
MSSEQTTNHNLNKWAGDDFFSNTELKENWDIIDAALGLFSSLPTSEKASLTAAILEIYNKIKATTDGESGADYVAATPVATGFGNSIQSNMEAIYAAIIQAVLGQVPADSITETQMAAAMKKQAGGVAPYDDVILKALLSVQGDVMYASAANTPARLAKGTAGQVLEMNPGATAPQWGNTALNTHLAEYATLLTRLNGQVINAKYPPAPLAGCVGGDGSDNYARIIAILQYMSYKGILYFPKDAGAYNISAPIHIGIDAADDAVNAFLVDGLTIIGEGSNLTMFNKTTAVLDKAGKDSIFYTNAVRTHFINFRTSGMGFASETIAFNLRVFTTMSSIKHCRTTDCKTGIYLDSVYIVDIFQYHVSTCKQAFDSSTAEKTSITIDKAWAENVWRFGYFRNINYSHFGTLLCDWANIPAPDNTYTTPVTFVATTNGLYEFYLCTSLSIDILACEHANSLSFLFYGGTSFSIDCLHLVSFVNLSAETLNSSGQVPIIGLNSGSGVKECIIDTIRCTDFTDITRIVYYPYASVTYGSKFVPYLTLNNIPYDVQAVSGNASTNNLNIMVKHPKSYHPIYWDKATPDATAKPFRLMVATDGTISSEEITYYYYVTP